MKRVLIKVLVVIALVIVAVVGIGCGYILYLRSRVLDGDGMVNDHITTHIQPAEGAKLVFCTVTRYGGMENDAYSYTLEQDGDEVLLYADYITDDNERLTIDGETVSPELLTGLNTLVLSMNLYETRPLEPDGFEPPLDAAHETYTLRWDDGTEAMPDSGLDAVRDYFTTEILPQTEAKGD